MLSKESQKDLLLSVLFILAIPIVAVLVVVSGTFLIMGLYHLLGISL